MTSPGKNFPGEKGFPTPNDVAPDGGYIVFRIPKSNDWSGLILGAAQLLSYSYNWYKWGDMTPDEAAEAFRVIVDAAPFNLCGCALPGGGRVIRININGHFEELNDDGEWQEPTGEYAIPPVPEREGSDPRCLAAANAENVLSQLYEQTVDMIAEGLSLIEIIGGIILLIATLIAGAVGLAAAALIEIIAIAFREFVATASFLGADVWNAEFSDALRCMLYECATDDAGIVTFDWDCLVEKLYATTNPFDLTGAQLRLLGQVGFLLNIISIDGLNLAGATTAITEADCSVCDDAWCFTFDLTETDADGVPYSVNGCTASWASGVGWSATLGGGCAGGGGASVLAAINITFPSTHIRHVVVVGTTEDRTNGAACAVAFPAINRGGTPCVTCVDITNGDPLGCDLIVDGDITGITAEFQCAAPNGVTPATGKAIIQQVTFYGNGVCPFGEPNCVE